MTTLLHYGQHRLRVLVGSSRSIATLINRPVTRSPIRLMTGGRRARRDGIAGHPPPPVTHFVNAHIRPRRRVPLGHASASAPAPRFSFPDKPHGRPTWRTHAPATEAIALRVHARISSAFDLFAPDAPHRRISTPSRRGRPHTRTRGARRATLVARVNGFEPQTARCVLALFIRHHSRRSEGWSSHPSKISAPIRRGSRSLREFTAQTPIRTA